jgi:hypothetical protein
MQQRRATLLTDGHKSYPGLKGYRHDPRIVGKMAAHIVLPSRLARSRLPAVVALFAIYFGHLDATGLLFGTHRVRRKKQSRQCSPAEPDEIVKQHDLPPFPPKARRTIPPRGRRIGSENTYQAASKPRSSLFR